MKRRNCWCLGLGLLAGCATSHSRPPFTVRPPMASPSAIEQVAATEPTSPTRLRPAYGQLEPLPIDLPTVLRLVNEKSPTVAIAQARNREAQARLSGAEASWLPNFSAGVAYNRFDGQTQNQAGSVFGVSRANLFGGGGPTASIDVAEAIYRPLIERRLTAASQHHANYVLAVSELEAVTAYLDLVQIYAQLDINADTLAKAEAMLTAARNAKDAKLDRTPGDTNRAQTEVLFRRTERIELEGRVGASSARLGRLLLLPANVKLVPAEAAIVPIALIEPSTTIDQLVETAIRNHPDLAANRELVAAAWERVRRQERGPFLPKVSATNQIGTFGGGTNDDLANFSTRNALSVQLYWEVKNLGFGNRADANERRAQLDEAQLRAVDAQARVASEIVEVAQLAAAKYESLDLAERAVKEATELYRINREGTLNVVDAKNLFDALRPLQAIQVLNQARTNYLAAVLDFNRAQYRLLTALGNMPSAPQRSLP